MSRSAALPPLDYVDEVEKRRHRKAIARRESYRREQAVATEPPSREEYALLSGLHAAQDQPGFSGRLVSELITSNWERMYPEQENVPEKIFGGYLVRRAYELASINAEEIAPGRPVILRVNRINFLQPVRLGDKLHFVSRVVYTGSTSICVEVNIERVSRDRVTRALSNTCIFTVRQRGFRHDSSACTGGLSDDIRGGRAVSGGLPAQPQAQRPRTLPRTVARAIALRPKRSEPD